MSQSFFLRFSLKIIVQNILISDILRCERYNSSNFSRRCRKLDFSVFHAHICQPFAQWNTFSGYMSETGKNDPPCFFLCNIQTYVCVYIYVFFKHFCCVMFSFYQDKNLKKLKRLNKKPVKSFPYSFGLFFQW